MFLASSTCPETHYNVKVAENTGENLNSLFDALADLEHQLRKSGIKIEELRP
jgi:hypothetical protein